MTGFSKDLRSKPQTAQLCCPSDDHPVATDRRGQGENTKGRDMYDKERKEAGWGDISISARHIPLSYFRHFYFFLPFS